MIKILLSLFVVLTMNIAWANETTLSVCRYSDGLYQFSFTGEVAGWWFNNFISADLETLIVNGDGAEFVVYYFDGTTESIFADPDNTPFCAVADAWKPSAPSILIPASDAGPYLLEILDGYGHWHLVIDDAHPDGIVLYNHAGYVELIGSAGQDIDPTHYRLITKFTEGIEVINE